MPKAINNPILQGVSGMLGRTVIIRQVNGRTILSKVPAKPEKPTAHQEKTKARFLEAVNYAREQMKIPEVKERYRRGVNLDKTNPYTVALADFLRAPRIHAILTPGYNGKIGSVIKIEAKDDFEVVSVTVSIYDAANVLVEEGAAELKTEAKWEYMAKTENVNCAGSRIVVVAADRPGNKTTGEAVLKACA